MSIEGADYSAITSRLLQNYFHGLVNRFFKILPIRESGEQTLVKYMQALQFELLGCKSLVASVKEDSMYLSLLSILQGMIDDPWCDVSTIRSEVFGAISICKKLESKYAEVC